MIAEAAGERPVPWYRTHTSSRRWASSARPRWSSSWLIIQVKNTGDRPGKETVQLYLEDVISSVATPVKQLRGFAKLAIDPGATKTCTFRLTADDLALYDKNLRRVVEPGEFRVMVGSSSEDIRLTDRFEVK